MLSPYFIVSFVIVGIYIASTFNQLFLYYTNRSTIHLLMVILGIMAALNLYNSINLHDNTDSELLLKYSQLNVAYYLVVMALLMGILFLYNGRKIKVLFFSSLIIIVFVFILNITLPNGIIFENIHQTRVIALSYHDHYVVADGTINSFYTPIVIIFYLTVITFLILSAINLKQRKSAHKVKIFVLLLVIFFGFNIYDVLIDLNIIISIYMTEFGMLPIILLLNFETAYELEQKKQVESELKEVNEHFSTLIENVELIVVGMDLNGNINYSNPYFIKLSKYSRDELMGKEFIPFFIPQDKAEEFQKVFRQLLKNEKKSCYETQILTREKEIRFIAWSNVLLHDSKGKLKGVLCVGADITERMQSRDKLMCAYKDIEEIKIKLEDENSYLKETINNSNKRQSLLIGDSDTMNYVRKSIKEVASTDSIVLIEGETGVGKELVAQAIYNESIRNNYPFIKVNCGALPKELIESELFGHEKGAFTGAVSSRKGRFELADEGTIFLDEIGELPLELQPRLLRVLQSGEFEKLGSEKTTKVNVRILAATNKNLKKCANEGSFREDLYYRLSVFPITVPPLRKRKEDIPDLVNYFVKEFCKKNGKTKLRIAISTIKKLQCYNWPGNIRELRNVLERAVITSNKDKLMILDKLENGSADELSSKYVSLEEIEKYHITKVLSDCNWKVSGTNGAATILDLNEGTLRSKMKKLGITRKNPSSSFN